LANLGCPTSIMKIYTLTFLFFILAIKSFAQFDRINSDPIGLNPSFAGSTGGHRVSNEYTYGSTNLNSNYHSAYNRLTYDGLFPKLKGGIGLSFQKSTYDTQTQNNTRNHFYSFDIVYAPKMTINDIVTWSPSINLGYAKLGKENETTFPYTNRDYIDFSVGILRNTAKTFYGISYNQGINNLILKKITFGGGIKFDKKSKNNLSSTWIYGLSYNKGIKGINGEFMSRFIFNTELNIKYRSFLTILSISHFGFGIHSKKLGLYIRIHPSIFNSTDFNRIRPYYANTGIFNLGFTYKFK
jgi:hypothetical protein